MKQLNWYGIRLIYKWKLKKSTGKKSKQYLYEERVTIWKAKSFNKAIKYAEKEAFKYGRSSKKYKIKYIGLAQAYKIVPKKISKGCEVFSLLRSSKYKKNKYLNEFFDTRKEHQGHI